MKKSVVLIIHCLLWVIMIFLFALINLTNSNAPSNQRISNFILLTIYSAASVYLYYFYLFPKYLAKKKYLKFVLYSFLFGLIISCITKLVTILPYGSTSITEDIATIFIGAFGVIILGQLGTLLRALVEWFNNSKLNEKLEKQKLIAEIAFLRSQINPHFMFNTLSNIDTQISENPKKASESLLKLSALYRYMVYEANKDAVQLKDEIAYLEDLVALQKMRLNNTKSVVFEVSGSIEERYIAPMLFVPFIENAFKHCSDKETPNAIDIRIFINEKNIKFQSKNVYQEQKHSNEPSGIGLEIVRKRLALLYPDRHLLNILKENNTFIVNLEITDRAD
jgi:two-component system, LytTR family, sensor kinase